MCLSAPLWAQDLSSGAYKKRVAPRRKVAPRSQPAPKAEKRIESIYFNLGTHTEFYNNVQIDESGGVRKFDLKAPTIGIGASVPMGIYDLRFMPEFNWVLPRKAGSSEIMKNLFMLRGDLAYDPWEWMRLRLGTSLMWLNQHGKGGKARISNGNDTSTFYYPDENRSSLNNTLDLGAELRYEAWALRLQSYIYSVFRDDRRQLSYSLFISYYWDQ